MDNKNKISDRSREEWLNLIERYFEAETSEEEELALKLFLASPESADECFNEIKAVLGYVSVGKQLNKEKKNRKIYLTPSAYKIAAAIVLCCIVSVSLLISNYKAKNECLVYINGEMYTDSEMVFSEMQNSIERIKSETEDLRMENQIKDLIESANDYNENDDNEQ